MTSSQRKQTVCEVEAERHGPAAHGERPLSGQQHPNGSPSHHTVSPPDGQPDLGATNHHLSHRRRREEEERRGEERREEQILDPTCWRTGGEGEGGVTSAHCLSPC
ncbi:hypothetical protein INR49_002201 [Caranx melampygus]|nr:hypothetical protein INR49_002201 [Caranx melampygus]